MHRPFLLHSCLVLTLSCLMASGAGAADKPNVLFIAIDDLNDWIGCLGGHPQARTPSLDGLASRSLLFTRAYCAAPACNPSRAALMTGIRPSTSGVYHNDQPWRAALPRAITLPQHFAANGYWTGGSGKMYHGAFPDPPSWQEYFPSRQRQSPPGAKVTGRPLNGIPRTAHFDWGPIPVDDEAMSDTKVANWVIEQLGVGREQPFFLACGFFRPHLPWFAPQEYFDLFPLSEIQLPETREDDLVDIPEAGRRMAKPGGDHKRVLAHDQWPQAVQGYLASIAYTDKQVGRVLVALAASEHADNTIVVLWTDHGWHLGEKQHWRKFALWEEATRTPLMVSIPPGLATLPGGTQGGHRCDRPVSLLDLYPTLIALCGLTDNSRLEGRSLVPLLQDPQRDWERPALTTHGRNNHSLRSDRWRYIRYADGSEELYDHTQDEMEYTNLADRAELSSVKANLSRWFPLTNVPDAKKAGKKK